MPCSPGHSRDRSHIETPALLDELLSDWRDFVTANPFADDAAVLGLIVLGILINWMVARSTRARMLSRREQWIRMFAQEILRAFSYQGAERIEVNWKTRSDHVEIRLQFTFGDIAYTGHIQENAGQIIDAIGQYASTLRDMHHELSAEDDPPYEDVAEEPDQVAEPQKIGWWSILGVSPKASRQEISVAYRRLARENHPDLGGSQEKMSEINAAREQGLSANP